MSGEVAILRGESNQLRTITEKELTQLVDFSDNLKRFEDFLDPEYTEYANVFHHYAERVIDLTYTGE